MKKLLTKDWCVYLLYIIIALVGIWLLTKLWVPAGYAIAGHDSGLAVNALEFFKSRLYAWDVQGFGRDNSGYFGSLIMHFIDFVSSKLSGVSYAGNQMNLFFWISGVFLSAGILAYNFKNSLGKYFAFLFPVFVTINFYILQSIFIFERSKYSVLVASLLFLTIYLRMRNGKMSVVFAGIISSVVFLLFNSGSWLGLPLYGNLLVLGLSILLFEVIIVLKKMVWKNFVKLILLFVITGLGFLILNAYSIFPYISKFVNQDFQRAINQGVISGNEDWLGNLSQASSYLNLFRLQGVPDWYTTETKVNPDHAYASLYTNNHLLVALSYVFPVLIFLSFIFAKSKEQKWTISLSGIILFIGAFFMAGSHPPLGFIYIFFYNHIPGFSIFRSPYYKFGGIFFIAASLLIAFSLSYLIERLVKNFKTKYNYWFGLLLALVTILLWLGFYSVIFEPNKIFTWQPNLTTRVKIPSYVYNFAAWFDKEPTGESRTLLVPSLNNSWKNDAYNWDYWSLTNLPSVASGKSFVVNSELEDGQEVWVDRLYLLLVKGDEQGFANLSKKLGIDYILLRNDVLSDSSWSSVTSPSLYEGKLNGFKSLTKIKTFGPWSVYRFNRNSSPLFFTTNNIISINQNYPYLSQMFYEDENSVSMSDPGFLGNNLTKIVNSYSCVSCPLEEREALTSLPNIKILPNSPLYFFKQKREERTLTNLTTDRSKVDAFLGFVLRRGAEIKFMWDFGLNTDYSLDSLVRMNKYLRNVKEIFKIYAVSDQSYFEAKRLLDNINVVEKAFKDIVYNYDFGGKRQNYRQGVFDVLWNINELKNMFPIINDKNTLETEKVYLIPASGKISRNLYIDENTLPSGLYGLPILPEKIIFVSDRKSIDVRFEQAKSSLLKIDLPENYGAGKIILKFLEFPNLLVNKGIYTEQSPYGPRSCIEGSLAKFNPNKKYRVEVNAIKPLQTLKLFLKDGEIKNGDSQFIQGQDEAEIYPTLPAKPFYHTYRPSSGASYLKIYLCNSDVLLPEVDSFEFHEIVVPIILAVDEFPKIVQNYPWVTFNKINSTHYEIEIKGATDPFILVFNEAYNQFWKLDEPNSQHFSINGYANAWKISKSGDYTLDLFYTPQSKFREGLLITGLGLIGTLALLCILTIFKKRQS